jgi:hypothetical protein
MQERSVDHSQLRESKEISNHSSIDVAALEGKPLPALKHAFSQWYIQFHIGYAPYPWKNVSSQLKFMPLPSEMHSNGQHINSRLPSLKTARIKHLPEQTKHRKAKQMKVKNQQERWRRYYITHLELQ